MIRFIGCNGTTGVDGTRYVLDFAANTCHGLVFNDKDYVTFEHFEIKSTATGSPYHGISGVTAYSTGNTFVNCYVHGWSGDGFNHGTRFLSPLKLIRCRFSDNDLNGGEGSNLLLYGCTLDSNGENGWQGAITAVGCISRDNTESGWYSDGTPSHLINCISHGNANDGIVCTSVTLIGGRITLNSHYGIDHYLGRECHVMGTYFDGNVSGVTDLGATPTDYPTAFVEIVPDGDGSTDGLTGWNDLNGGDTDYGYEDSSADDYNLDSAASIRAKALTLQG
jgi:hypothetical protein